MSVNKYDRLLQELSFDSYWPDCPAEIEKGALLLDTESKTVLLQLCINVLSDELSDISSITIRIEGFDDKGAVILEASPFRYIFRNVFLMGSKTFGDKTPIVLEPAVRRVAVSLEQVVFTSGKVWEPDEPAIKPPPQKLVKEISGDLFEQFTRDISNCSDAMKKRLERLPAQYDDYWLCACGRLNTNDAAKCCRCGAEKQWVFWLLDQDRLQKRLLEYRGRSKWLH